VNAKSYDHLKPEYLKKMKPKQIVESLTRKYLKKVTEELESNYDFKYKVDNKPFKIIDKSYPSPKNVKFSKMK
jgi:hypothetical protein